jgi:glycosyltransferase involved in cell wall biosynthesis
MQICILSSFEDSLAGNTGYSVRICNLARGLVRQGNNKVQIILPSYKPCNEDVEGLKIIRIKGILPKKLLELLSKIIGIEKPASLYFFDPVFIFKTYKVVQQCDIVQLEQQTTGVLFAIMINLICKKPLVVDCHDVFQSLRIKFSGRIRRFFETFCEKLTYRFSNLILAVSGEERKILINYGISEDKIRVVPNSVDIDYFNVNIDASIVKKKYGLQNHRVVVFVGNLEYVPNKEAAQLIVSRIAPIVKTKIKDVKFLIVGRTQTKFNSSDIVFTGVVDNVAEVLRASDVAIAPLLHGSGTRLKILEYFSCGLPVVSTTIGVKGLPVKNGIHLLIEDDLTCFASKIVELLKDKELSVKLGEQAKALVVNNYDWTKITGYLHSLYQRLLAEGYVS